MFGMAADELFARFGIVRRKGRNHEFLAETINPAAERRLFGRDFPQGASGIFGRTEDPQHHVMMPRKQRRRLSGFRRSRRNGRRFRNGRPGRCRVGRLRELLYGRRLLRLQRFGQRIGGLDRSRRIGTLRPDGLNRNGFARCA